MRAATGGGLRKFGIQLSRPPLSAQQQDEYTSLLAIAMANQLVPLSTFDKKPQKHIAVVGQEDAHFVDFDRFTLHSWLIHVS